MLDGEYVAVELSPKPGSEHGHDVDARLQLDGHFSPGQADAGVASLRLGGPGGAVQRTDAPLVEPLGSGLRAAQRGRRKPIVEAGLVGEAMEGDVIVLEQER